MQIDRLIANVLFSLLAEETAAAGASGTNLRDELVAAIARACSRLQALATNGELAQLLRFALTAIPPSPPDVPGCSVTDLVDHASWCLERRWCEPPELLSVQKMEDLRTRLHAVFTARPALAPLQEAFLYIEDPALQAAVETWLCDELEAALKQSNS